MAQAGITEIMAVGRVYRKFTDFFTDPMRIPGKFGQKIRQNPWQGRGAICYTGVSENSNWHLWPFSEWGWNFRKESQRTWQACLENGILSHRRVKD